MLLKRMLCYNPSLNSPSTSKNDLIHKREKFIVSIKKHLTDHESMTDIPLTHQIFEPHPMVDTRLQKENPYILEESLLSQQI